LLLKTVRNGMEEKGLKARDGGHDYNFSCYLTNKIQNKNKRAGGMAEVVRHWVQSPVPLNKHIHTYIHT
jgi:hypothetical protein